MKIVVLTTYSMHEEAPVWCFTWRRDKRAIDIPFACALQAVSSAAIEEAAIYTAQNHAYAEVIKWHIQGLSLTILLQNKTNCTNQVGRGIKIT